MRDLLASEKLYFTKFIDKKEEQIANSLSRIEAGEVLEDNLPVVKNQIFIKSLEKLIATYSKGYSIGLIKTEYISTLNYMVEGWDDFIVKFKKGRPQVIYDKYMLNEYCYMIWMLSLAILLEVSENEVAILESIIEKGKINDELIVLLLNSLTKKDKSDVSKTTYKPFSGLIKSGLIDAMSIKNYLDKWYPNTKLLIWHNYKSSIKSTKFYYGYWSFEAAAVVKVMGLDDTSFIDHQYYPKDLLHQLPEPTKKNGIFGKLGF